MRTNIKETVIPTLIEGPKGGVCVRFYEENKAHLRFTKIIDSHLRFTKIIRKYIGISWFSLRKHVIWSFIYDHVCVCGGGGG